MSKQKKLQNQRRAKKQLKAKKNRAFRLKRRRAAVSRSQASHAHSPEISCPICEHHEMPPDQQHAPEGCSVISSNRVFVELIRPIVTPVFEQLTQEKYSKLLNASHLVYQYSRMEAQTTTTEETRKEAVMLLRDTIADTAEAAEEIFAMLAMRCTEIFPKELQLTGPLSGLRYVMKKTSSEQLTPVDYQLLEAPEGGTVKNEKDCAFVACLEDLDCFWREENKRCNDDDGLDEFLADFKEEQGRDYDETRDGILIGPEFDHDTFDKKRIMLQELACAAFADWLAKRLVDAEAASSLARTAENIVSFFIEHVYWCGDVGERGFKDINEEEMSDLLLGDALDQLFDTPQGYLRWPSAIKLFYRYLFELSLIDGIEERLSIIAGAEARFYSYIEAQFGAAQKGA